ncbi:MAG: hypothetical protein WCK78_03415 [Paludibacter sp.]
MEAIKASSILKIDEISNYKLHLACYNGEKQPLDVYVNNWVEWVGWNEYKGERNDFSRQYIFSLIQIYNDNDKWLFGGVFKVKERTENAYIIELQNDYKEMIGRLIIDFHRYQGLLGRAFNLENHYENFVVSEILKSKYGTHNIKK